MSREEMITLEKSILIRDMNNEVGKENADKMEFTRQMSEMYNLESHQNTKRLTTSRLTIIIQ